MKETELKPCPFCGSRAILRKDIRYPRPKCEPKEAFVVVCPNFDCIIGLCDDRYRLTKEEAIEAWNRRADNEQRETD